MYIIHNMLCRGPYNLRPGSRGGDVTNPNLLPTGNYIKYKK